MRDGAFEYDLFKGVKITKYHGSGNVSIPSKIKGSFVKHIGKRAFSGCKYLTEIIIPDTVISIDELAFSSCSSLKIVIIPDSVTSIGDKAFDFCKSLSTIYCPKKLMDSYYVKNFLDSYKNKIHYYNVPSNYFLKVKGLSTSELVILIERMEKVFNNISRLKNLSDISSELINLINRTEYLFKKKCSSSESEFYYSFPNYLLEVLLDIETEYKRQYEINSHPTLMSELSGKIGRLEKAPAISSELLALIKQVKADYPPELNDSVVRILADIETEYNRQYKIKVNAILPSELLKKVNDLENAPTISPELLALIKQVKADYSPELNDSVAKILANIEAEYNRQQEKNSVINLVKLMESVSDKQITNASQYIQKFDNEVVDFLSKFNVEIEALTSEKTFIQNRLKEQKSENENLINSTIVALTTEKNAIQTRLNEQKRENENRIRAAIEKL